jgi:hypothetical protein
MLKGTPAWRKRLFAKPRIAAIAVALLAIAATVSLSGGKAYASGTNCGSGTDGLSEICMYIDGYSNVVVAAVGEVTITGQKGIGEYDIDNQWINFPGHIQVVNPAGQTLCNSDTETLLDGTGLSCESAYQGATYTGNYCTILWAYLGGGEYDKYGEECLNVFTS